MPHVCNLRNSGLRFMKAKLAMDPLTPPGTNQTPFERFKAALARVVAVPKSSLPKTQKKTRKK